MSEEDHMPEGTPCNFTVQCSPWIPDDFAVREGEMMRIPNNVLGCCGKNEEIDGVWHYNKTCTLYDDPTCENLNNRPLKSPCSNNYQCADSCCSLDNDICVAPLLDCKN